MTGDVLPYGRGESYADQEGLVASLDRHDPYEVPTTLKAVVCISSKYFKSGERRFRDTPCTYTRCREEAEGLHIVVGGFDATGFDVGEDGFVSDHLGIGAMKSAGLAPRHLAEKIKAESDGF